MTQINCTCTNALNYISLKRIFDFSTALLSILLLLVPLLVVFILVTVDTSSNGIFAQIRVGQHARLFHIYKFKTVHPITRKISVVGKFLRKYKIDELPQLVNVLKGDMSFVGPRPDVPGYYDQLEGEDRELLALKPGITSEASLKYYNEEEILQLQPHPLHYNDTVIFPDKVKINRDYQRKQSLWVDLKIMVATFTGKY